MPRWTRHASIKGKEKTKDKNHVYKGKKMTLIPCCRFIKPTLQRIANDGTSRDSNKKNK